MYSDFFDLPDDDAAAAADKSVSDADKLDEVMDYSSNDEKTGVTDEKHSTDGDRGDETPDDDDNDDDDDDDDVKQTPMKKAKHKFLSDT